MQPEFQVLMFLMDYSLDSAYFENVEEGKDEVGEVELLPFLNRWWTT
jgi:hypothetical protein